MLKRFNTYFTLFTAVIDLIAVLAAMLVAYRLRANAVDLYLWAPDHYLRFVLKMLPVWLILFASQGLYNLRTMPRGWNAFARLSIGLLSGWGVMIIVLYLWRTPAAVAFPRLVIAYGLFFTLAFTFFGRVLISFLMSLLHRANVGIGRVAVVTGTQEEKFVATLRHQKHQGLQVAAVIQENYLDRLKRAHAEQPIDELVVNHPRLPENTLLELLDWAESKGINFVLVPTLLGVRTTNVEVGSLAGTPVMYFQRTPLDGWGRVFKRILDLLFVIPALVILSPVLLVLAILVKLSSKGPVFYRQPRVGQDGRAFYIRKFRSMYENAEKKLGIDWSTDESKDPRITPIGHLLRRTNLDELPQLFDILLGRMSIVGPRPEQPKYVEKFSQEIPNYLRRHHVKSGLTGWAQINGLRGDTSIPERVKYDLYYIEHWTIWFDLRIILSTFVYVFKQLFRWAWR